MYNQQRKFDDRAKKTLGEYIYALRDPRDNKVFYIGKGSGDRLFDHFNDADNLVNDCSKWNSKIIRIIDIWKSDLDVEWFIIRYGMLLNSTDQYDKDNVNAFDVEAAVIDVLGISQNGPALNDYKGHHSNTKGLLSMDDAKALSATPVSPTSPYATVFIFPIHKALQDKKKQTYDATRGDWRVPEDLRSVPGAIAVGLEGGISQEVYTIDLWVNLGMPQNKWKFNGQIASEFVQSELNNKNWQAVINRSGYWRYGNFLVVEFDGKGKFRFIYGSSDKKTWFTL